MTMTLTKSSAALLLNKINVYRSLLNNEDEIADKMYDEETTEEEGNNLYSTWNVAHSLTKAALESLVTAIVLFSHKTFTREAARNMIEDQTMLNSLVNLCKRA